MADKKKKMDFTDGMRRGFVLGQLHTAIKILGDVEENAVLTKRRAYRILSAANIANDMYREMIDENARLSK